jgi:hypothetical protein
VADEAIESEPQSDEMTEKVFDESWISDAKPSEYQPLTPPSTPIQHIDEGANESSIIIEDRVNAPMLLMFCTFFVLIVSVLYSLRCEIQANELRISVMEAQNNLFKEAFDKLEKSFHRETIVQDEPTTSVEDEIQRVPPLTKTVWLGNEREDKVEILDKKLPDYCFFTDEDDLFYEHNMEVCKRKKRKLALKSKKKSKEPMTRPDLDELVENYDKEKSYDDYISEMLKSLNDEIQEIKSKRGNSEIDDTIAQKEVKPETESASERRRDYRDSKRPKLQSPGEWIDKRTSGREEARKNRDKEQQDSVNWYLKRKSEREALRVATDQPMDA